HERTIADALRLDRDRAPLALKDRSAAGEGTLRRGRTKTHDTREGIREFRRVDGGIPDEGPDEPRPALPFDDHETVAIPSLGGARRRGGVLQEAVEREPRPELSHVVLVDLGRAARRGESHGGRFVGRGAEE